MEPGYDAQQVPLRKVPERVQQFRHAQGDGRLARAGAAGEGHVKRRPGRVDSELATQPIDDEEVISRMRVSTGASPRGSSRAGR
jgi:hypothetical protein